MADQRLTSDQVLQLLQRDLLRTTGDAHAALVNDVVSDVRELETEGALDHEAEKIVSDVQQHLHDTRDHATWPACPRHKRHPLWYRAGAWWCVEDGVAVAPLGELPASGAAKR